MKVRNGSARRSALSGALYMAFAALRIHAAGADAADQIDEVIVTGTHIRGAPTSAPMVTVTREDIDRSGYTTIGDVIRGLPQNFAGGNNPGQIGASPGNENISVTGGSSPNLRGLGSGSTLTLINGHRLAPDAVSGAVDVSLIPMDAIERVEVVTDGASAVHGSDAVAGVVNIILKKDYSGSATSASYGGATEGGALQKDFSQLVGTTFPGGGVILSYEYQNQAAVYSTQRSFSSTAYAPTTLWPATVQHSVFLSAHETFAAGVSGFIDALVASRNHVDELTFAANQPNRDRVPVKQCAIAVGLKLALAREWQLAILPNFGEQKTKRYYDQVVDPSGVYTTVYVEALTARTQGVEVNADGRLFTTSTGPVRMAVGGGYRKETLSDILIDPAMVFGSGQRTVRFGYAEFAIPLVQPSDRSGLRRLDLDISGRYDGYSDTGGKAVPRIGMSYVPTPQVTVRASWGKSFRAPPLDYKYGTLYVVLLPLPDPLSPTGTSNVLLPENGNRDLQPETATTWAAGLDYKPIWAPGLKSSFAYFNIHYTNRISALPNPDAALTDPTEAPFVTRNPSSALQQSYLDAAGIVYNDTGLPWDPATIAAIVNNNWVNFATQDLSGVDLTLDYRRPLWGGEATFVANGSYLDMSARVSPSAPTYGLAGKSFSPPRFRARAGASWTTAAWDLTATLNYLGAERNTYQPDLPPVASWTTLDVNVTYTPLLTGPLAGLRMSAFAQNVFDRQPPRVQFDDFVPGIGYDSTNASPLGRFVGLRVTKKWK